jgi:hypothetical protein
MRLAGFFFVGEACWKRPLGRPRHRCKDIKIVLDDFGCRVMKWIYLDQDRDRCRALVNSVMNLLVP